MNKKKLFFGILQLFFIVSILCLLYANHVFLKNIQSKREENKLLQEEIHFLANEKDMDENLKKIEELNSCILKLEEEKDNWSQKIAKLEK